MGNNIRNNATRKASSHALRTAGNPSDHEFPRHHAGLLVLGVGVALIVKLNLRAPRIEWTPNLLQLGTKTDVMKIIQI
jgi:hypothetical protein